MADSIDRRSFLKVASLAGGGLMVGLYLDVPDGFAQTLGRDPGLLPNAFVRIAADGTVTIIINLILTLGCLIAFVIVLW